MKRISAPAPALLLASLWGVACRVASLPPSSSRTDGGPVASRGVVSHEARSQVRLYRDAAGCPSVQTVNRQFRLVTVAGDAGPERLVLEESYDVRRCLTSEGTSSEATITAWRPDSGVKEPLFRINGRGAAGAPAGNLYRMVTHGCCGSQALASYFSLTTGKALFTSSVAPLTIRWPAARKVRYVGFHDTFSSGAPDEAAADSLVIGVLQYGDDRAPAQRIVVSAADRADGLAAGSLSFRRAGRALPDTALRLTPGSSSVTVRVDLVAPGSGRRGWLEVPLEGDSLSVGKATASPGIRIRGRA